MAAPAPAAPPAAAPAAPVSTPAPAPAAPNVPQRTSTTTEKPPASRNEPAKPSWLDTVGDELSALDDTRAPVKPADTKEGNGELEKAGEVVPPAKPDDKATDKPVAKPEDQPAKPFKAAELRAAYDNLKKEKREVLEPKIQQLEAKLKELESRQPEDTKPIVEKMTAIEKRNAELEQHIQFLDYRKSKEFTEKYEQPFAEAWSKAVTDFGQLTVKIPAGTDEVTGEPKFSTREATQDDLLYLANLPLSQMDEQAEAMFGRSAARVIRHVERVRELSDAQNKALADAQKKAGEWSKTRQFQMQQFQQVQQTLWGQFNREIVERFPKMFGPDESDPEGNALLQKGYEFADQLFAPARDAKPLSPEQRIQRDALMRNKIANHDRLVLRLKKMNAELEEARKALAAYEKSEPPAGRGAAARTMPKSFDDEVAEELAKLDRP